MANPTPTPNLETFKTNLTKYGKKHGEMLLKLLPSETAKILEPDEICYYDPTKVYLDIAAFFPAESIWIKYAEAAKKHYSEWVLAHSGKSLVGYWVFSEGLAAWLKERPQDTQSKAALSQLVTKSAFAALPPANLASFSRSRENAYLLLALLDSNLPPDTARIKALTDNCYSHMDQWFGKKSATFVKSFMVGLTAYSMIRAHEKTPRQDLVTVLKDACDELWDTSWVESASAFKYSSVPTDEDGDAPSPDLNQLISPMYAFVWSQTHDENYLVMADKIFSGGVLHSYFEGAKQYFQSHRLVFHYLDWRADGFTQTEDPAFTKLRTEFLEMQKEFSSVTAEVTQLRNKLTQIKNIAS
jgi:hypothetical protein